MDVSGFNYDSDEIEPNSEHANGHGSNSNAVSSVTIGAGDQKGKRKGLPAKNLMVERRRRKKLNDRLYMLRSVVPKISKVLVNSHNETAGIVVALKDKSPNELQKLLSNKDAYQQFLHSLDIVQTQIRLRNELRNETMQLAKHNLEKEPHIRELRNQCQIIRATELATAREKLNELEKQKQEILRFYSPSSLLHRLQESMHKTEEESEALHQQLLNREIDLAAFTHKYKRLRNLYHKQSLTYLATNTSFVG